MSNEIVAQTENLVVSGNDLKGSFEQRLRSIQLSEQETQQEQQKAGQKIIRDKLAGLFEITDLINTVLKWNEDADKALKSLKRDKLMETYFRVSENNEQSISAMKELLTSASGNVLFNKIIGIIDDNPPDQELIGHLALALRNIVFSDFEQMFSEHRHALAQIGRLTPQALTVLADAGSWPRFQLGSFTTDGGVVRSEWNHEFSTAYATAKSIRDTNAIMRMGHSISELQTARLVLAAKEENGSGFRCYYSAIGNDIRKYIS